MMKRDLSKEFGIAFGKELEACGLPGDEESREVFRTLMTGRVSKKLKGISCTKAIGLGFLAVMGRGIKGSTEKRQFKSEAELGKALEEIHGLRYRLRPAIAEILVKVSKMLPQKKRGPKPKLTDAQKQSACSTIDSFMKNGMSTKFAIQQTAQSYKVAPRMMRRAWETHARS